MQWSKEHKENASRFSDALKKEGFNFFTGVPCSLLGALIENLEKDRKTPYLPAVREDSALGMASGTYLAGRLPVVLMQNSGLGYSLNVLTSLNLIYKIPILCLVGFRGFGPDAPEHVIMGKSCIPLLEEIGIRTFVPEKETLAEHLTKAKIILSQTRTPVALFIKKGIFGE